MGLGNMKADRLELFWKKARQLQKEREDGMEVSYFDYDNYCKHCGKKIKKMSACVTEKSNGLLGKEVNYYHQQCFEAINEEGKCTK